MQFCMLIPNMVLLCYDCYYLKSYLAYTNPHYKVYDEKWPFFKSISTIRRSFYELQICSRGALCNFRPIFLFNLLQWPIIRHISCVGPLYKDCGILFCGSQNFQVLRLCIQTIQEAKEYLVKQQDKYFPYILLRLPFDFIS